LTVVTGIDIQSISEVKDSIGQFGHRYLRRIYSELELRECEENEYLARNLAVRFAAKEAVIKALRPRDHIAPWRTIEILLRLGGGPKVILSGEARTLALESGVAAISLSTSVTNDCAVAVIVADVTNPRA
jgi:holo-[acyl-carrier protein] synthase